MAVEISATNFEALRIPDQERVTHASWSNPRQFSRALMIALVITLVITLMLFGLYYVRPTFENSYDDVLRVSPAQQSQIDNEHKRMTEPVPKMVSASKIILQASGYVSAQRQAIVASTMTARVSEVYVTLGQRVEQGQILAQLDSQLLALELDLVEAEYNASKAKLEELIPQISDAKLQYQRELHLIEQQLSSRHRLEQRLLSLRQLEFRYTYQQKEILVARQKVSLGFARLAETRILAPFNGVVTHRGTFAGEVVSPISVSGSANASGICTLIDMQSLRVEVDINERNIAQVFVDQMVQLRLDSDQTRLMSGRVNTIIPRANRNKATVRVLINIQSETAHILPDMGVQVDFFAKEEKPDAGTPGQNQRGK